MGLGSLGSFLSSAGGGGIAGGLIGGIGSAYSAYQSGKDAREMQKRQIDWERQRATSAHQWEVQDLKAAGLNPILSAGGSGAVTGGISAPLPDRSGYANIATNFSDILNGILNSAKTKAETKNVIADTEVKNESAKLIMQQTLNEAVKNGLISAQKAGIEFDNLKKQYDWEKRDLTYWNDFINRATGSVRNASEAISLVKLLKMFKNGGRGITPDKLEKMLYGGQGLPL